jgi:hypothetical protein
MTEQPSDAAASHPVAPSPGLGSSLLGAQGRLGRGAALAALGFVLLPAPARSRAATQTPRSPVALTASQLTVNEESHLHLLKHTGEALLEEGVGTGSFACRVRVSLIVGTIVHGAFTIYLKGGSISGHANARLHPGTAYSSFAGSLSFSRGTGHYVHVSGSDRLYGVLNRTSYNITVQVIGKLGI